MGPLCRSRIILLACLVAFGFLWFRTLDSVLMSEIPTPSPTATSPTMPAPELTPAPTRSHSTGQDNRSMPEGHTGVSFVSRDKSRFSPVGSGYLSMPTRLARMPTRLGWRVASDDVTFQVSILVDDSSHVARVPLWLQQMQFCFAEVLVVFDVPHGGCNYGPVRLAGGPRTFNAFMASSGDLLLNETQGVLADAQALHAKHCDRPLRARAEIVDYNSDEVRELWSSSMYLDFEPPNDAERKWPFAWMWKNTMSMMFAIAHSSSPYIFHVDDDFGFRLSETAGGLEHPGGSAFIMAALEELRPLPSSVYAQMCPCEQGNICISGMSYKSAEGVEMYKHNSVSTQAIMISQQGWRSLFPLRYWRHFLESVMEVSLKRKNLAGIWFSVPSVCKLSFEDSFGAKDVRYDQVRDFKSEALMESFDPTVACKFR